MDELRNEIEGNQVVGVYVLNSMASNGAYHLERPQPLKKLISTAFPGKYFLLAMVLRDEVGYKITGRVDDVLLGHNLGTAPIETP
jgi:acyl-coenzyme A synthetase/AMP-(fatty) acid ligase